MPNVAVVAHVFYEGIWPEIAAYLRQWGIKFRLYATVPERRAEEVSRAVWSEWRDAVVTPVQNRGRDIAPFLDQAERAIGEGMELICKIHTKRSSHLARGHRWRRDLYRKLLGGTFSIEQVVDAFTQNATLGILAPEGHVLPHTVHWHSNAQRVLSLAAQMGYEGDPTPFMFAAGSMFWIRTEALAPILNLSLIVADFEEEAGQLDGTLAHALERLFPLAAELKGLTLRDTRIVSSNFGLGGRLRSAMESARLRLARFAL